MKIELNNDEVIALRYGIRELYRRVKELLEEDVDSTSSAYRHANRLQHQSVLRGLWLKLEFDIRDLEEQ